MNTIKSLVLLVENSNPLPIFFFKDKGRSLLLDPAGGSNTAVPYYNPLPKTNGLI